MEGFICSVALRKKAQMPRQIKLKNSFVPVSVGILNTATYSRPLSRILIWVHAHTGWKQNPEPLLIHLETHLLNERNLAEKRLLALRLAVETEPKITTDLHFIGSLAELILYDKTEGGCGYIR